MSRTQPTGACFEVSRVNACLRHDPDAFIAACERHFRSQIDAIAEGLSAMTDGLLFVMLCGPSSAGKTTTTKRLCDALAARGTNAQMISLDDFYMAYDAIPLQADGTPDLESPKAIDAERLHACVGELRRTGQTQLPQYDFKRHAPSGRAVPMTVSGRTVIFLEGVHAFSPTVIDGVMGGRRPPKVYVNTVSRFVDGGETLLGRRDLRLTRRLLRDERYRHSPFYNTMTMWDDVIRGLMTYILPYADDADYTVDTTVGYEPSVMAGAMRERLPQLYGTEFEARARQLFEAFGRFEPLPPSVIPTGSVLNEFV